MNDINAKKTYSRFGLTYALGQMGYTTLAWIASAAIYALRPELLKSMSHRLLATYIILIFIAYPAMYFAIRNLKKTEIPKKSMGVGTFLACIPIVYALIVVSNTIGTVINMNLGRITGKGAVNPVLDTMTNVSPVIMFIVAVICAPICEELTFRKFLVDRTVAFGEKTAMIMSGVIFGLYHGNLSQFAYAFVIGMFFAFVYIRTGKIIYTIIFHMFVNCYSTVLTNLVTKSIDINEMMGYLTDGNIEAYMNYCTENAAAIAAIGAMGLFSILFIVVGVVFIIIFSKKFVFMPVEGELEKGHIFRNVILNVGMIVFITYCLVNVVFAQIGLDRAISDFLGNFIRG